MKDRSKCRTPLEDSLSKLPMAKILRRSRKFLSSPSAASARVVGLQVQLIQGSGEVTKEPSVLFSFL